MLWIYILAFITKFVAWVFDLLQLWPVTALPFNIESILSPTITRLNTIAELIPVLLPIFDGGRWFFNFLLIFYFLVVVRILK